jgi:hypothetical protein
MGAWPAMGAASGGIWARPMGSLGTGYGLPAIAPMAPNDLVVGERP